ncbi:MAG: hypothetical protein GY747_03835 [Planctomycetes bacterium]|nr:hypothetical protein [Planctomycetota bacterium]MCP4770934.1 hypothetical protein [Planctomycetota bacterium]MCP4861654.1 hypothetical protein [Planctomycetota bacterium]
MFISLLFFALQDSAPQAEAEPLTSATILNKIEEVSKLFSETGTKLKEAVEQVEEPTTPTTQTRLQEALLASEHLVAEMEALLKLLPD